MKHCTKIIISVEVTYFTKLFCHTKVPYFSRGYELDDRRIVVRLVARVRNFCCSPKLLFRFSDPPNLLLNGYWDLPWEKAADAYSWPLSFIS